jgi:hypothetical protein
MQDNKEMTQQESLMIIQQMIQTAKQEQKDDGRGWIIWGWMLFLASILTVINSYYNWVNNFFFWNAIGLLTIPLMLVERFLMKKTGKVKTYTATLFEKLNTGFFICILFIIVSMNIGVSPVKGFALLIGLYGFWILIYGAALDFKPSIIAAYIVWAFGAIALFQIDFNTVMLLHAAAVLCGYIIPGHVANIRFKKEAVQKSYNKSSV